MSETGNCIGTLLPFFHKIPDLVMAADHEEDDFIGELKQDAILETGPDFPIVGMPVFQAKTRGEGSISIKIIHQDIKGLIDFLLAGG